MSRSFIFGIGGSKPEQTKTVDLSMATGNQTVSSDSGKVLTQVTINKPITFLAENIKKDITIGGVLGTYAGGESSCPTLNTISISRSSQTLNISNPSTNGNFVSGYKIYGNNTLIQSQTATSFNLSSLEVGTFSITVKAYGTDFNDSAASNPITYSIYSISNSLTNLTTSNSATKIDMEQPYSAILTASTGMYLPDSISLTMGGNIPAFTYSSSTGAITVASVTGDMIITGTAEALLKLDTPVLTLTQTTLSWTAISNATSYSIRSSGTEVSTTTGISIDLSTLFPDDGSYTITVVALATGYRDSNPSTSKTYVVGASEIYGVSNLYASDVALTRTDNATDKDFAINSSSGSIVSDFDSLFPWNESTVETISGNKFLHLPHMWFRVGTDSNKRITDVAVSKTQGSTGSWYEVNDFYYSCYGGSLSNSKLASVSGATRLGSATRAQFRSYATANGSGYFQEDLYHRIVMTFLWWIEWATKNSKTIMKGYYDTSGRLADTGGTDNISTASGYLIWNGQMRYHYIEDFIGNQLEWVEGSVGTGSSGGSQYVTADPTLFSDSSTGLNALSYNSPTTSGDCNAAYGWDANNPFLSLPIETVSNSNYNTYFSNKVVTSNGYVLYCGSDWRDYADYGLSCFYRRDVSGSAIYIGGRLLYKPL